MTAWIESPRKRGTLIDGVLFENICMFMLRVCDGRIGAVAEHFNARLIGEKMMPLLRN